MTLPTIGKPSAREVADWAIGQIGKGIDVDGYHGNQCWDLPNYLFKRYWGFTTSGNAVDMQSYSYPRGFRFIRNTPELVPQAGWIAVWDRRIGWAGHTDIVIDGATVNYFYGIDQNWINANNDYGSPAAKIKHNYYGVVGFVVPPYRVDKPKPKPTTTTPVTTAPTNTPTTTAPPKPIDRDVTTVKYTKVDEDAQPAQSFEHYLGKGTARIGNINKIIIQNEIGMLSVQDLYKYKHSRNKNLLPHYYVDRYNIWHATANDIDVLGNKNAIVVTICEDMNAPNGVFLRNELEAVTLVKTLCDAYHIPFDATHVLVEKHAWRTYKMHSNIDITSVKDFKDANAKIIPKLLELLKDKDKIIHEKPKDVIEKTRIKVMPHSSGSTVVNSNTTTQPTTTKPVTQPSTPTPPTPQQPTIVNAVSSFTFDEALNKQMTVSPQVWSSGGFVNAGRGSVSEYMNTSSVWNNEARRYEMLDLGKSQGISADKLNQILQGQGTLSGTGAYFAEASKKYSVNEIYLIAHAIVETGHGNSNFASGSSGVYNFFGIAAYDSNPNAAITYARNHGWTTKQKAIVGGAEFVRNGYINAGQQTLYRMRWNPQAPATHQYATAVNWAASQAQIIEGYYKQIGLKGMYYIKDVYR